MYGQGPTSNKVHRPSLPPLVRFLQLQPSPLVIAEVQPVKVLATVGEPCTTNKLISQDLEIILVNDSVDLLNDALLGLPVVGISLSRSTIGLCFSQGSSISRPGSVPTGELLNLHLGLGGTDAVVLRDGFKIGSHGQLW